MSRTRRLWSMLLSVAIAGFIGACATDSTGPTPADPLPDSPESESPSPEPPPPESPLPSSPSLGFVKCTPQPYASSTAAIGPAGGVINVNGHRLTIPAGALDSAVVITMEAPSDTIRSVRFAPEGLTFNAAHRPKLRMDYSQCGLLSLLLKRIVYTDEQLNILEQLLTLDLFGLLKLESSLDHFSRYAIHY